MKRSLLITSRWVHTRSFCAFNSAHSTTSFRVFSTATTVDPTSTSSSSSATTESDNTSDHRSKSELTQRKFRKLRVDWSQRKQSFIEGNQRRYDRDQKLTEALQAQKPEHHRGLARIRYIPTFPTQFPPTDLSKCDWRPLLKDEFRKTKHRRVGLIGYKVGMQTLFDHRGFALPATVIRVENNVVVQIKHEQHEKRGTYGLQVGAESIKFRRMLWSKLGHYIAQGVPPKRWLKESRVGREALLPVGTELDVRHFMPGQFVDVRGTSKGKGFQGVMRRWNFKGGPATRGSRFHRTGGSKGGSEDPGKVWKGQRMAGRMGGKPYWRYRLQVFRVDAEHGLIWVKGMVPGVCGKVGRLYIRDAHKEGPRRPPFPTFFPPPNEPRPIPPIEYRRDHWRWHYRASTNPDDWLDAVNPDTL